jgi:hypothetical protein
MRFETRHRVPFDITIQRKLTIKAHHQEMLFSCNPHQKAPVKPEKTGFTGAQIFELQLP